MIWRAGTGVSLHVRVFFFFPSVDIFSLLARTEYILEIRSFSAITPTSTAKTFANLKTLKNAIRIPNDQYTIVRRLGARLRNYDHWRLYFSKIITSGCDFYRAPEYASIYMVYGAGVFVQFKCRPRTNTSYNIDSICIYG